VLELSDYVSECLSAWMFLKDYMLELSDYVSECLSDQCLNLIFLLFEF